LFSLLKRKAKKQGLVGVSLNSDGVAVARIVRDETNIPKLDICHYLSIEDAENISVKLNQFVSDQDLEQSRCTCVMGTHSHSLLLIEAPDVQPAELKAAIRWRIKDLIDFHIDDAVIDVFEIPEQGAAPGRARLMYAVAARASNIHANISKLDKTTLELDTIDIPELAIRNITCLLDDDIRGVAFLYLSADSGLITLTRQGALFLSRDIDVGLKKMQPSTAMDSLHPETEQSLEKIVLEVQRSLDYYESHFSQPPISSLVIAPMEQEVAGVLPYLSANLGIAVSMLNLDDLLESDESISTESQIKCLLAIGAALRHEQKVL